MLNESSDPLQGTFRYSFEVLIHVAIMLSKNTAAKRWLALAAASLFDVPPPAGARHAPQSPFDHLDPLSACFLPRSPLSWEGDENI